MDAALSHSIVDLYARFKDYSLRPKIDRSPYGPSDEAEALLHSKPLNQLTWIEFGAYPGKAITTFGNLDDYKHFLPRILELITVESDEQFYIADLEKLGLI